MIFSFQNIIHYFSFHKNRIKEIAICQWEYTTFTDNSLTCDCFACDRMTQNSLKADTILCTWGNFVNALGWKFRGSVFCRERPWKVCLWFSLIPSLSKAIYFYYYLFLFYSATFSPLIRAWGWYTWPYKEFWLHMF